MIKGKCLFVVSLIVLLVVLPLLTSCTSQKTDVVPSVAPQPTTKSATVKIGGAFDLTGPYAQNCKPMLQGFIDYVKYVNETKQLAPWRDDKFPENVTIELLWGDTHLEVPKVLSVYEDLTSKGILTYRTEGTDSNLALKDRLVKANLASTTNAPSAAAVAPPATIFTNTPIYSDSCGAYVDWFLENWKEDRPPRFAFLTADSAFGRSVDIPEVHNYLKSKGIVVVGSSFVPMVCTAPPTTQLMWLKENKVDFTFGAMIGPGGEPTLKEAARLGMGPHGDYKITFGQTTTFDISLAAENLGKTADGAVWAGVYPPWGEDSPGVKFATELQNKYHPQEWFGSFSYFLGLIEAMLHVEAVRLALEVVPADQLKPADILNHGFHKIKNFSTGNLTASPLTYGPSDVEGVDRARIDTIVNGKHTAVGSYPLRGLFPK